MKKDVIQDWTDTIVELKTGFSLALIHQGIERQKITDAVYIAVPRGTGKGFRAALPIRRGAAPLELVGEELDEDDLDNLRSLGYIQ